MVSRFCNPTLELLPVLHIVKYQPMKTDVHLRSHFNNEMTEHQETTATKSLSISKLFKGHDNIGASSLLCGSSLNVQ